MHQGGRNLKPHFVMSETGINKVMQVWESENKIISPSITENLLEIVEQIAEPFAAGTFFYFVFDLEHYKISMVSKSIQNILGLEPNEFTLERFFKILHPEDTDKINEKETIALDFFLNHLKEDEIPFYKASYLMRLQHTGEEYKTILHQVTPITISNEGKIQRTLCVYTDVTHLNLPIDHKISFLSQNYPSFYSVETESTSKFIQNNFKASLTERELEIINNLAEGKSFKEIAAVLFLSPHTINTHKKNILRKTKCKNTPELITKCVREGVI